MEIEGHNIENIPDPFLDAQLQEKPAQIDRRYNLRERPRRLQPIWRRILCSC